MNVDQLMHKDPACCTAQDSLNDAAQIMWEHDCGFVPVVASEQDRKVIGVLTDRDVCMAAYTRGERLTTLRIADSMTTEPTTCRFGDTVEDAENAMRRAKARRIPVVDDANQLVGVLSLADLAQRAARSRGKKAQLGPLGDAAIGELLATITEPRSLGPKTTA